MALVSQVTDFTLFSKSDEKPLYGFRQGSDIIRLVFMKGMSGSWAESELTVTWHRGINLRLSPFSRRSEL